MAHTALHFAVGLGLGMALAAPAVGRAMRHAAAAPAGTRAPLSPALARLFAWSWSLGLLAVVPNVLRALGLPEGLCGGAWMNLFLLHPLLDRWVTGGMAIGGGLLVAGLGSQYALILLAILLTRRRTSLRHVADPHPRG